MSQFTEDPIKLADIVSKIENQDMQGLEDLQVVFGVIIKRILMRLVGLDWEEHYGAVLYEVFEAVRKHGMRNPAALPGIVSTITRRTAFIEIKRRSRFQSIDYLTGGGQHSSELPIDIEKRLSAKQKSQEESVIDKQNRQYIAWAFTLLSPRDRDILHRFYILGQSPTAIQNELGWTENQFRLRKFHAKSRMTKLIHNKMKKKIRQENSEQTELAGNVLAA